VELFQCQPLYPRHHSESEAMPGGDPWWLTTVYGPQDEQEKVAFLEELRQLCTGRVGPWLLCGDFNLIYKAMDKSCGRLNRRLMGKMCRFLQDLELLELHLQGASTLGVIGVMNKFIQLWSVLTGCSVVQTGVIGSHTTGSMPCHHHVLIMPLCCFTRAQLTAFIAALYLNQSGRGFRASWMRWQWAGTSRSKTLMRFESWLSSSVTRGEP
jgi:hypothetical protein